MNVVSANSNSKLYLQYCFIAGDQKLLALEVPQLQEADHMLVRTTWIHTKDASSKDASEVKGNKAEPTPFTGLPSLCTR